MSQNNLKAQLQQFQDKQKNILKDDKINKSQIVNSNQKQFLTKEQPISFKNKENMHSQIQLQASTKESSQLLLKKNSQNEQTIHSDIFNTSNNSKIQGVLALKFSNTYTQPLQARGEIQSTVSDVYTLESIETLNTNRSNNNYNQKIVIGEDNKIHSQHISLQNAQQNRRYSINSNSSFQQQKQPNEQKTIQTKMHNNYALKIESSEERILNACQLNFDDGLSSQQNEEQDPSIYNYNYANNAKIKIAHRNQSQDSTFNNNTSNRNSPFYANLNYKMNEKLNFQKKVQNCSQQNIHSNSQKGELLLNIQNQKLSNEPNQKTNTYNQYSTNAFQNQEVCNSNFFNIGENEGEKQILKSTKEVYLKENTNNQYKSEVINTLNFNTETEDKKIIENIFTTNSDMPSIILHKTLKSEVSNIFQRGFTLNDQPSSKNQMSFINEVEEENTQRSRGTNYKTYQNGNYEVINQFDSSQRVLTLNPNQEIHENQIGQNVYNNLQPNAKNEDSSSQHFFYQYNQQCIFQNNIYNTPTLKGRLTENTNNSLDFQENRQEPQINQFAMSFNNSQKECEQVEKNNFEYPSMFDRNSKFYHESEASVCNEMQEIYSCNNDKPSLKTLNIPNKVNNPALLSSHATEDNNSFLNSHRHQMNSKSGESFSGIKNEKIQIEAQQDSRQQVKKQNIQEQVKNTQNNKQEQFLQQYENKRPHFLSQEIQIPIVSNNYPVNQNNEYQDQQNYLAKQNTFQNDCSDEDQFTKNLNSLINNNQENQNLNNIEKYQIVNQPLMKRDSEEQSQRFQSCPPKNNIAQNYELKDQIFAEYNQEKIKKMNEEIRQKLRQINLNQTTLNSTIQVSQTPTSRREQDEKSYNCINSEQYYTIDQSQRHKNQSQESLDQSINQPQGQPSSHQYTQNQGNVQPPSSQKSKQGGYSIVPISYQASQSQISNEQSKSQSFQNQKNQEKCFNTTCSNILQYQDINPNLNKQDTRIQEDSSQQSLILVDHKSKQQQIQSTQSTLSSGLNKRSISNSRYDKYECKENTNRTTQNASPNHFVQLNQSIIPENKNDNNIQEDQKQQKIGKRIPPQLDPNISYGDDLQINPLDVISPQEKIANYISFQTGQQEDPHLYPSFQQPSSYYSNYPLFANHDTEIEIQNNKVLENKDNISLVKNSFYQQQSEQQNNQQQNSPFLNQFNSKIQNKSSIKNAQQNVSNNLVAVQENLYKNNKININNLNYTNDAILPPSCSSKNSIGSNQNANHYYAFSYKQFFMNMKKNLDSSLIKETAKKQKQNDSFIKKIQTNKKPITENMQNDKNTQNKDFEKLNKLIDQQIQKNVIRPLIKRQRGDKEIVQNQSNCRTKASFSHHTPSTPKQNVNSIPNSQRPVPIEIPSNLDKSLQHYFPNQCSQKNSFIQSNKSQSKISSKSTQATPKQNKQPSNSQLQIGNQQLKNTNFVMNNNISFNVTPSTSKNNLDRNHSFCLPKERSYSYNKRDSLNNKRNACSKSPVSRTDSFSNVNTKKKLMIPDDIRFNSNNNTLDFGHQAGFYTNKHQNYFKRDQSQSFLKHSSKK